MSTNKTFGARFSWIAFGRLVNALVNIVMVPYLARALKVEEYGTYGQVLLVLGIFKVLFSFGIVKLVYRELSKEDNDYSAVYNILIASFIVGVLGVVVLHFSANSVADYLDNPPLGSLLKLYGLSIVFGLITEATISCLNYFHQVKSISILTILSNLARVSVIFISVQYYRSLEYLFIGLCVVEFLYLLSCLYFLPKRVFNQKVNFNEIIDILKKGLPLSLAGITTTLLVQTDGVMVSKILSTEDYAIYRMGAVPIPFLFLIYSSMITITMADVTKLFKTNDLSSIVKLKKRASTSAALLIYPLLVFLLVFSSYFISIYLGKNYLASQSIFMIYNLILFLRINDFRDVSILSGKTKYIFFCDLSVFILNIILNYIFINMIGAMGAAIASIISYYTLAMVLQIQSNKILNTTFLKTFDLKKLFLIAFTSLVFSMLLYVVFVNFTNIYVFLFMSFFYMIVIYWVILKVGIVSYSAIRPYLLGSKQTAIFVKILDRLNV